MSPALSTQFPEPLHFASHCLFQAYMARRRYLYDLLEDYNLRRHGSSSLPFRFGRQEVARITTHGAFSPASSTGGTATPNLACLELVAVQEQRDDSVRRRLGINRSTVDLMLKHQDRLRPTDKVEDPYIVATLVALAQEQHHQDATRPAYKARSALLSHTSRRTSDMGKGACHCHPISDVKEFVFLHSLHPRTVSCTIASPIPAIPQHSRHHHV